jgi:hypothetical protein
MTVPADADLHLRIACEPTVTLLALLILLYLWWFHANEDD